MIFPLLLLQIEFSIGNPVLLTLASLVPCGTSTKEANQKGYIQKSWHHAVKLVGQPEIGKVYKAERSHDYPDEDPYGPKPGLMMERLRGIQQKGSHQCVEAKRSCVLWDAEGIAKDVAQDAAGPDNSKHGCHLHDVLLGQVISWIQLKDEDVVHTGRPPAVDIDAPKEEAFDDEEWCAEHPHSGPPVLAESVEHGSDHNRNEEHHKGARKETNLEGRPRTLLFAQWWYPQPLHCPLTISSLDVLGNSLLRLLDQPINVLVGVKVGCLHVIRAPTCTIVDAQQLVVLLKYLTETREVEVLIVLEQYQSQIKFTKCQLEILYLARRHILLAQRRSPLPRGQFLWVSHFQGFGQLAAQTTIFACRLGHLLRVECVDLGQLLVAVVEELLIEFGKVSRHHLALDEFCGRRLFDGCIQHGLHFLKNDKKYFNKIYLQMCFI